MGTRLEDDANSDEWVLDDQGPYNNSSLECNVFLLKEIKHNNVTTAVVLQNQYGPCALVALVNVLLISQRMKLPLETKGKICKTELVQLLENVVESEIRNRHSFVSNSLPLQPVLHSLISHDVQIDPIFTGIGNFVNSTERALFDILQVPLYHAWIPNNPATASLLGSSSYSQLHDEMCFLKTFGDADDSGKIEALDVFLKSPKVTEIGWQQIGETMQNGEGAVFLSDHLFRTAYKQADKVFQLVTETKYKSFRDVVWETVANFGASTYFDETFRTVGMDAVEAELVVEEIPIGNTSAIVTIPEGMSKSTLEEVIFKKVEKASRTTLTLNGNALTITGTPHNVEHTKIMVEIIAHNHNPVVPDRTLEFKLPDMENATVKNLVKQWQQLYMLIHKRQDMERLEPSACRVMADYLSEFTGIPLNNRMGATIMELWLSMDEHEQSFWYSEKMRKRQIKLEKQCAIDLQIRNLNRNIAAASRNLWPEDSKTVFYYLTADVPKKRVTKYYCQFQGCNKYYQTTSNLLRHEKTCPNSTFKTSYLCEICNFTMLTVDGFNIHVDKFHPVLPVAEMPQLENEPGEKSPVPLPVEQSETAVFRIPGIGRARLALNYDFHGFMEYVNTAVDGTFRFQDVTSIEGYSFSGITAMESKNLFRNILHSNLPNGGQVTVVLQRNSIRIDDHRPPSIALIDTSSAHSETERPTPIASVMIDTSTSPLETRHETSMSCDSNDTYSTPAEILGESSMGASATERVNVKAGPAMVVNVGLPQCKAPKTPAGNDSGKVVYWKGHDAKVTVAYMLQNASTFGRITNMSLHNVSQDATTSFIEFETEESANRFANSCPQRFKKSKYSAIRTRDKAVLKEISDFYRE